MLKNLVHNFLMTWKFPRWRWALMVAVLSDALGFGVVLWPPAQWLLVVAALASRETRNSPRGTGAVVRDTQSIQK